MTTLAPPSTQIEKFLKQSSPPRYVGIIGTDRVRRERVLSKLAEGLALQANKKWLYTLKKIKLGQSKEQELKDFIIESSAISLFSPKQVFLIEELEKISEKQSEQLVKLIGQQSTDNYFIFTGTSLPNHEFLKAIKKSNALIDIPDLNPGTLRNWIKQEFKSRKLTPENQVIEEILQNSELSADLALSKIEQLELFAKDHNITMQMLEELFPAEFSAKEYAWLEAIASNQKFIAQKMINFELQEGRSPLALTAILQNNYLNYYVMSSLLGKGLTGQQIIQFFKMKEWSFKKQFSVASQKDPKRLIKDLKALALADSKLKNKSLGAEAVLTELVNSLS